MSITQHEGWMHSYEQPGLGIVDEGLKEYKIPIEVRYDEVPDLVGDRLLAKVDAIAGELARQTSKEGFRKLEEELSKVGNAVDAGGRPVSQEVLLEMLEKMEMSFDDAGNPDITFIVHPVVGEVLRSRMEEWHQDVEFRKRHDELISRKREAWRDRESNRKLVD
jgi:hypothetical protein